jgi:hypothetical protein
LITLGPVIPRFMNKNLQSLIFKTTLFHYFFSAVSQYVSIPISFLSLSLSSTKLFYSQRLGMFMNADPSPKQLLTIFPLVILQIIGPLISLVFVALYLRQFIFLCIIFIIVTNYLVLKIVLFKCQPFDSLRELYRESR